MRPEPVSSRSARRSNARGPATTTSFVVAPSASPGAASGSDEVAEMNEIAGDPSWLSDADTLAVTRTYLWFGGDSDVRDSDSDSVGGVSSAQSSATTGSWSDAWSANSALTCTGSISLTRSATAGEATTWSSACELPSNT